MTREMFGATFQSVLNDLIPMIDKTFRTVPDSKHRAMAGLSWVDARHFRSLSLIWICSAISEVLVEPPGNGK